MARKDTKHEFKGERGRSGLASPELDRRRGRGPHGHQHGGYRFEDFEERPTRGLRAEGPADDVRGPWAAGGVFGPPRHGRRGWGPRPAEAGGELRTGVAALIGAVRQVAMIGDESQRAAARVVVDGAARAIYSILAASPTASPEDAEAKTSGETAGTDPQEAGAASDAGSEA